MKISSIMIALFVAIITQTYSTAVSSPLYFTKNVGQIAKSNGESSDDIKYVMNSKDASCYFFDNKVSIILNLSSSTEQNGYTFDKYNVTFHNPSSRTLLLASNKQDVVTSYISGNEVKLIENYRRLLYSEIYPLIDVEYLINEDGLKYNVIVKPGGNISDYVSIYEGNLTLDINQKNLQINTAFSKITENIPESYYINDSGEKVFVDCKFKLLPNNSVSFEVGEYDQTKELVIDPTVRWSTYIGSTDKELIGRADPSIVPYQTFNFTHNGSDMDYQTGGLFIDSNYKYIVGSTYTIPYITNFPEVGQSINYWGGNLKGNYDLFVAKYDKEGVLIASCVFGGTGNDFGMDIIVHNDTVHVVGISESPNFPTTYPPIMTYQGGFDIVYIKLGKGMDLYGSDYLYSSYMGGSQDDIAHSITADQYGSISIVGETVSSNFPVSFNAEQPTCNSCSNTPPAPDAFYLRVTPNQFIIDYCTFIGGDSIDNALKVKFKQDTLYPFTGYYYIVGATLSSTGFPLKQEIQSYLNNDSTYSNTVNRDGFIHIIKQSDDRKLYSTYYGRDKEDILTSIDFFAYDDFVVVGGTKSAFDNQCFFRDTIVNIIGGVPVIDYNQDCYHFNSPVHGVEFYPLKIDRFGNCVVDNQNTNGDILLARFQKTTISPYAPYIYFPIISLILGGSDMEFANDVKVMPNQNILLAATSNSDDFALKHSFMDRINKPIPNLDVLVLKLDPIFRPLWSSLFRSESFYAYDEDDNRASAIAFSGNDFTIVGESGKDYVVHEDMDGGYSRNFSGPNFQDVFITTINDESRFPTYLGSDGNYNDLIEDIYSDEFGVYVTGRTQGRDLPKVLTAYQGSAVGNYDIFVTKYGALSGMPEWTFIYGGEGEESGMSITKKGTKIYVTGYTNSDNLAVDPDTTIPQNYFTGQRAVFVLRMSETSDFCSQATDVNLDWFTYMGSNSLYDEEYSGGEGVITDFDPTLSAEVVYVCGYASNDDIFRTNSTSTFGGFNKDAFVAKFNEDGTLLKSRFLGGENIDVALDLAKVFDDRIGIVGYTCSDSFPTAGSPFKSSYQGGLSDKFFTVLDATDLDIFEYSTFFGDSGADTAYVIDARYLSTGNPLNQYSKVYIGGHQYYGGFGSTYSIGADVNIFRKFPYTSWEHRDNFRVDESPGIGINTFCYDLYSNSDDSFFAVGTFEGFKPITKIDGIENDPGSYFAGFISKFGYNFVTKVVTPFDLIGVGLEFTNTFGRAISRSYSPFVAGNFPIIACNTDAYDLIDLTFQNYPPYQATNAGLYDGILVKWLDTGNGFKLYKETIPFRVEIIKPAIYPNPANDLINFSFGLSESSTIQIEIVDLTGYILYRTSFSQPAGICLIPIDIQTLQAGTYFIQSQINNNFYYNKFVKY